jgi:hypothetical protein
MGQFGLQLFDLLLSLPDVDGQELDVVLAILEFSALGLHKLIDLDGVVVVHVYGLEQLEHHFFGVLLVAIPCCLLLHELNELL